MRLPWLPADPVRRYIESMERTTVVAHISSGASIQGVLTRVYDDCVVLEHAWHLSSAGRTSIDGEAVIERVKVAWLQVLPAEETQ